MEENYWAFFDLLINLQMLFLKGPVRVIVGNLYCDISLGLYVIRGENVVLIGELDLERDDLPPLMKNVLPAAIRKAQKAGRDATDLKGSMRKRMEFLDLD